MKSGRSDDPNASQWKLSLRLPCKPRTTPQKLTRPAQQAWYVFSKVEMNGKVPIQVKVHIVPHIMSKNETFLCCFLRWNGSERPIPDLFDTGSSSYTGHSCTLGGDVQLRKLQVPVQWKPQQDPQSQWAVLLRGRASGISLSCCQTHTTERCFWGQHGVWHGRGTLRWVYIYSMKAWMDSHTLKSLGLTWK